MAAALQSLVVGGYRCVALKTSARVPHLFTASFSIMSMHRGGKAVERRKTRIQDSTEATGRLHRLKRSSTDPGVADSFVMAISLFGVCLRRCTSKDSPMGCHSNRKRSRGERRLHGIRARSTIGGTGVQSAVEGNCGGGGGGTAPKRILVLAKVPLLEEIHRGMWRNTGVTARLEADPAMKHACDEHNHTLTVVHNALLSYAAREQQLQQERGLTGGSQGTTEPVEIRALERIRYADVLWADMVIPVGGDGTFLRCARKFKETDVATTLIMGVNSAPSTSHGFYCVANHLNFAALWKEVCHMLREGETLPVQGHLPADSTVVGARKDDGLCRISELHRMQLCINGVPKSPLVLNDVLITHTSPGATAKYVLSVDGRSWMQQSSGAWFSTSSGSAAAMRSAGGEVRPIAECSLQYRVRELASSSPFDERRWLVATDAMHSEGMIHVGRSRTDVEEAQQLGGLIVPAGEKIATKIPCVRQVSIVSRMLQGGLYLDGSLRPVDLLFGDEISVQRSRKGLRWVEAAVPVAAAADPGAGA